jgi:hypothetical protein
MRPENAVVRSIGGGERDKIDGGSSLKKSRSELQNLPKLQTAATQRHGMVR